MKDAPVEIVIKLRPYLPSIKFQVCMLMGHCIIEQKSVSKGGNPYLPISVRKLPKSGEKVKNAYQRRKICMVDTIIWKLCFWMRISINDPNTKIEDLLTQYYKYVCICMENMCLRLFTDLLLNQLILFLLRLWLWMLTFKYINH